MQNTQFSFQLYSDGIETSTLIDQLIFHDVQMYTPISPNINWNNISNWVKTKNIFRCWSHQIHLSSTSNKIGQDTDYFSKGKVGSAAIITTGLWASKVTDYFQDDSGMGSFTITTIQGANNKKISFVAAYIAVSKGSDIGIESLYAQQVTLYEQTQIQNNLNPQKKFCP